MTADFPYRPEQITAFASAPCLTSVSIVLHQSWEADNNSPPGENNFDFISLPYRQLVDLHCADVYEVWWNWPETRFIRRAFVDMLDTVDAPSLRSFSYTTNAKNVVSGTAMPERPPPTSGRTIHGGVIKLGVCHPDILERYAFPALADLSVGDLDSVAGAQYPVETMSLIHSMLVASASPLTVLRLFGVVLDEYFLSTFRLVADLEVLEIGIFSWSKLPSQDTVLQSFFRDFSVAKSSAFELLPALRCLRIKISLDSDDIRTLKPHSDSRVPIRHFGFANETLAHALKVRCRHRSLDFAMVVMADKEYTWELDLNDLCESSGLCAAVQRKGVENRWEPVYSEGERFLDKLEDDDRCKLSSHEQCCHDVHPPKVPKPCADCSRRKEDDEFWKAGVI